MSPAHERAARRLAGLSAAERGWILARLAPADAVRIREAMEREPALAQPEAAYEVPAAPAPEPGMRESATPESATPESRVARGAAADILQVLRGEPDWLVALVLGKRRWPWDREVLNGLEPARVAALGEFSRRARDTVKPRACEASLAALAAKLQELAPAPPVRSAFDDVLDEMTAGAPAQRGQAWPS
jgi:hypothetical protein